MANQSTTHATVQTTTHTAAAPASAPAAASRPSGPETSPWNLVLRRLPAIVWTTDHRLRITSAGGSAFGELALDAQSLIGRPIESFFANSISDRGIEPAHRAAMQGTPATLDCVWNRKLFRLYIEPHALTSEGSEGCVGMAIDITPRKPNESLSSSGDEQRTAQGSSDLPPAAVAALFQSDLEERRLDEQELRDRQERFAQLAATIESAFWIFDLGCQRVLYLSPGYERIWGIRLEEALAGPGNAAWRGLHPEDAPRLQQAEQLQRVGQSTTDEFRIIRPDGSVRWIHARSFPIHGASGEIEQIAGIAEDITCRKYEELSHRRSERLATLGNFTAGIAHEINNPLGAALAATQAAQASLPKRTSQRLRKCLTTTEESVRRCAEVVRSLLHFCRDEPAQRQPFDVRQALQFAVSITQTYAQEHACQIELELCPAPLVALGSSVELDIVFVNLLRNAVEAQATEVRVAAALRDGQIELRVDDNGRGFTEDDAWRLCDPFFTTRRDQGGTGMGLSVVHAILRDHGGRIDFEPNPPSGATAIVTLPCCPNEVEV